MVGMKPGKSFVHEFACTLLPHDLDPNRKMGRKRTTSKDAMCVSVRVCGRMKRDENNPHPRIHRPLCPRIHITGDDPREWKRKLRDEWVAACDGSFGSQSSRAVCGEQMERWLSEATGLRAACCGTIVN